MRYRFALVVSLVMVPGILGACGNEIGDACTISADCSPDGDRVCDRTMKDGYCTVQGCDISTCPGESVCVRFFTSSFSNRTCEYQAAAGDNGCTLDELCSLSGLCVARSSEVRFCMRTCGSNDDCRGDVDDDGRDDYECRDLEAMKAHGGEPVVDVDERLGADAPKFCAEAPP